MEIKLLDDSTIKKIAAGEVVDRPASIVKELIENSIDANALNIEVEIFKGGLESISVRDDGHGIASDQIENAFKKHATSKIDNFDDLYALHTMGFRGEALPSIAAVARVEVKSKVDEENLGASLTYADGKLENKTKLAMNRGTSILVKELFDNIPVRKNFLRSPLAEGNSINDLMYRLAIGNPQISFRYLRDGKLIFHTLSSNSYISNAQEIFGSDFSKSLIEIKGDSDHYSFHGYISDNSFFRGNRSLQYLYVNGRNVNIFPLEDAIERSYHQIIPNGKFPGYQIFIETSPSNIDVNIHPNKKEIHLSHLDELIDELSKSIKARLSPNLMSGPRVRGEDRGEVKFFFRNRDEKTLDLLEKSKPPAIPKNLADYNSMDTKTLNFEEDSTVSESLVDLKPLADRIDLEAKNTESTIVEVEELRLDEVEDVIYNQEQDSDTVYFEEMDKGLKFSEFEYIGSIFNTYLIFQVDNDKMILMDQHAAHERVNYENILSRFKSKSIESQILVDPILLELLPSERTLVDKYKASFKEWGFSIDDFSFNSLALRSVPSLGEINYKHLFIEIIEAISKSKEASPKMLNEMVAQSSCKASVRAGDRLGKKEVARLLDDLSMTNYPLSCPHGRPIFIIYDKTFLEKEFSRIK